MIKTLPNLNDGIQIVGFLKDVDELNQEYKLEFEGDQQ